MHDGAPRFSRLRARWGIFAKLRGLEAILRQGRRFLTA